MSEYFLDCLNNGLRLVTVPMDHLHSAEMVAYLAVGGRHETPEQSGIAHFLEHMLFRGTKEYPTSRDLERAFEVIGGSVNASTDAETTCFHSRLHPAHLNDGVALFASMLRRPRFEDIDIERRIILEEAQEDFNEQGVQINPDNLMAELLWPNHPLGHSLIGTTQSISAVNREQIKQFYHTHYSPKNLLLCCCGPLDRTELRRQVEEKFGDWSGPEPPQPVPAPQAVSVKSSSCWVRDSDSQISIQLAFRLPGRNDERTLQMGILRRLLSWGGSAILPLRLREQLGLTYAVEANCSLLADTGYLAVDLAVRPENLVAAIGELLKILEQLCLEPVSATELEDAVRSYLYDLDYAQDQPEAHAVRYGWGIQADYLRTVEEEKRALRQLSPLLLRETAMELLRPENLHLVIVGPWEDVARREVEKLVGSFRRS